jgi:hypothetical protein
MHSTFKWIGKLLAATLLLPLAQFAHADEPRADVGVFAANGKLTLDASRFLDKFPDGSAVTEVKVDISNGFYYLARKGYRMIAGECRREFVQLLDANSQPLVVGSTVVGQHAWILTGTPVKLVTCADDGCHALKNVVLPGDPPLRSARCDITELSAHHCKCHLDDGSGVAVTNGDFCRSLTEIDSVIVGQWVKLAFVQT